VGYGDETNRFVNNPIDPEKLRVTACVDAQRAETGRRLVYDKTKKDFVDPKDLPVSQNAKFKYVQLPIEGLGKVAVADGYVPLLVVVKLEELWFAQYQRNPVKLATFEVCGVKVSQHRKARALRKLEAAGLVLVEREARKSPLVTLLWRPKLK
jgi:hypothetical protein